MARIRHESRDAFPAELTFKVQAHDIDVAGIVSNIVYVRWLEELRQEWCDRYYPTERMFAQGFVPAIGMTQVEYLRAIRFGDAVAGAIWFEGFRGQRWNFGFEIVSGGAPAALARQSGVFITLAEKAIREVPAEMVERFGRRRGPAGGGEGARG